MNYENLSKKYLLLDTNILVDYSKYIPFFEGFFDNLQKNAITTVISPITRIEFLRFAASPEEKQSFEEFISPHFLLPPVPEISSDAELIGNFYNWELKNNKIELGDLFLAATMKKFNEKQSENLYLATMNHKDFPRILFKRIGHETIDIETSEFKNIGIYAFDLKNYKLICEKYQK